MKTIHSICLVFLLCSGCGTSRTLLEEIDGGEAGTDGDAATPDAGTGDAGLEGDVDGGPPASVVLATGVDIRDVTADDERVYWIEYGTTEVTGRHRGDGVVRARALEGGAPVTLITGLLGPVQLHVTSTHAFVWLDRDRDSEGEHREVLVRAALTGGPIELLQVPAGRSLLESFVAVGDRAIWAWGPHLYQMRAADSEPQILVPNTGAAAMQLHDGSIYFTNRDDIFRTPLDGPVGFELMHRLTTNTFAVHEGRAVTIVQDGTTGAYYLVELEADGTVRLMLALENFGARMEVADGRLIMDGYPGRVLAGSLVEGGTMRTVIDSAFEAVQWVPSAEGILWIDGSSVQLTPF